MPGCGKPDPEREWRLDVAEVDAGLRTVVLCTVGLRTAVLRKGVVCSGPRSLESSER